MRLPEEKMPVCHAPFLINQTTCSKATMGDWFGVAVNEAVCAASQQCQSHSVIFNKRTSYELTREMLDDFVVVFFDNLLFMCPNLQMEIPECITDSVTTESINTQTRSTSTFHHIS